VEEDTRAARVGRDWSNSHAMPVTDCARSAGTPGFSAAAIATLALGIGGITAMFSAFDTILIRPPPYDDADRLVMIWLDMRNENRWGFMPTPAEWLEWRRHNTVFTDIAAPQPGAATVSGDSEPSMSRPAKRRRISGVLGVKPLIGRVFTEEEGLKGVRVAVISHRL
jgi:putative ABC transport system permease protein